jgi:hypothetical protein
MQLLEFSIKTDTETLLIAYQYKDGVEICLFDEPEKTLVNFLAGSLTPAFVDENETLEVIL